MQLNKVVQWLDVLHLDPLLKLLPLVVTTVVLIQTMEHFTHPLVLPGVLAAIPLLFHVVLLAAGLTLEQAQDAGWAMKPTVRREGAMMMAIDAREGSRRRKVSPYACFC